MSRTGVEGAGVPPLVWLKTWRWTTSLILKVDGLRVRLDDVVNNFAG